MKCTIIPISPEHREPIMDIFNYYVENSFAAYPERALPYEAFDMFLQSSKDYPTAALIDASGTVVGFGMLRPHNQMPAFCETAEATYFLHPDHRGRGLGKTLLTDLEKGGRKKGITHILANISSENPESIRFHERNGFVACGRFKGIGKKKGRVFDTVWMQKTL